MIKELRIGNWVGTFKPHKVNGIYLSHFTATDENGLQQNSQQYNLEPIPLTPEILEKARFDKHIDTDNEWYGAAGFALHKTDGGFLHDACERSVDTLHQLQNLYFALTGTELEINLNP